MRSDDRPHTPRAAHGVVFVWSFINVRQHLVVFAKVHHGIDAVVGHKRRTWLELGIQVVGAIAVIKAGGRINGTPTMRHHIPTSLEWL